jgi:hypothetical protein
MVPITVAAHGGGLLDGAQVTTPAALADAVLVTVGGGADDSVAVML